MNSLKLTAAYEAPPGAVTSYYSVDLFIIIAPGKLQLAHVDPAKNRLFNLFEYSYSEDNYIDTLAKFLLQEDIFQKPYRKEIIDAYHQKKFGHYSDKIYSNLKHLQ